MKTKNFKLDPLCGSDFDSVSKQAKQIATDKNIVVEFDFNGVKCLVDKNTNAEWLYRDYRNSWTMDWKTVGPDCVEQYPIETQNLLEQLTKIREEKAAKDAEEYRKKEATEKAVFDAKINGVELELKDIESWNKSRETNTDSYGKVTLDYAEGWAKLMQLEINTQINKMKEYNRELSPRFIQNVINVCAEKTSFEMGFMGISGFMYGCAVSILSQCWVHGEELRKWHNKEYGYEGVGVVNPAIMTIKHN